MKYKYVGICTLHHEMLQIKLNSSHENKQIMNYLKHY